MYNRKYYLKYISDPKKKEQMRIRDRERKRKISKDPEYIKKNRKRSLDNYKKIKNNPILLKELHEKQRVRREKIKYKVLLHYSGNKDKPKCVCCGESIIEFLTADHENNDGNRHRKEIGTNMYEWLIKNNLPKGFRTMCMNCNWGRRLTGICPHKK